MTAHLANRKLGLGLIVLSALGVGFTYWFREPPDPATSVFDEIYESGVWGRNESGQGSSGEGSTEQVTRAYRAFLENLIREERIGSVVDAGCGDWEFSQYIDWGEASYLGIDVSSVVLKRVDTLYAGPKIRFQQGSLVEELPPADLLIVKDVLQHLTNQDILQFIRANLRPERYRIAVLTNDRDARYSANNEQIPRGGYRGLDLSRTPFKLEGLEDHQLFEAAPEKLTQVLRLR